MQNNNKVRIAVPRYQQIAVDIASKIVNGNYNVGDKVYARSALAAQYGVSSETARRAICILSDLDIVISEKGSGVLIKSYENATKFIKQYQDVSTINDIKKSMIQSVERQKKEMELLNSHINDLISKTEHFRSINPFVPSQIQINSGMFYLNKTIGDISFWEHTGATVVAFKRDDEITVSPGPYAVLKEDDILYFVGQEDTLERVNNFLYPNKV